MPYINTGNNKYALLIGINYRGQDEIELTGCINDINNVKSFLINNCNYTDSNIIMMSDDHISPTKYNILNQLGQLVDKALNEDVKEIFLAYSGHGSFVTDTDVNTESDSRDEVLVPIDWYGNADKLIKDDDIYNELAKLPSLCNLFALIDCCNSGTILDLPNICKIDDSNLVSFESNPEIKSSSLNCNIIKIAGCKDNQTSAETFIGFQTQGVLTNTFLKSIKNLNYNCTGEQLIKSIKSDIATNNYTQIPTLSCSATEQLYEFIIRVSKTNSENNTKKKRRKCIIL
uniref:Peptidase C14 caspase domain-containing protein n=1 Tax=viral metagenome TaxID=1070528 RepID=A0A6C0IY39_9ZZZZ